MPLLYRGKQVFREPALVVLGEDEALELCEVVSFEHLIDLSHFLFQLPLPLPILGLLPRTEGRQQFGLPAVAPLHNKITVVSLE